MSPPALDRVVRTCLAKDPDDRWQTARDVGLQLQGIRDDRSASQPGVIPAAGPPAADRAAAVAARGREPRARRVRVDASGAAGRRVSPFCGPTFRRRRTPTSTPWARTSEAWLSLPTAADSRSAPTRRTACTVSGSGIWTCSSPMPCSARRKPSFRSGLPIAARSGSSRGESSRPSRRLRTRRPRASSRTSSSRAARAGARTARSSTRRRTTKA